jgi:hypothetical protein
MNKNARQNEWVCDEFRLFQNVNDQDEIHKTAASRQKYYYEIWSLNVLFVKEL